MADNSNNEIGRELSADELTPQQVVVIAPPDKNLMLTMWVEAVDPNMVIFFSRVMNWHVINLVKDGTIVDDRGRQVRVFEYLGEI